MTAAAPIELTFYKSETDDEILKTFSRSRVPTYLLDMAMDLQKNIGANPEQETINQVYDFIVEFFGKQFTREELKKHTDLVECLTIIPAIVTRATQVVRQFATVNPTGPSPKRK